MTKMTAAVISVVFLLVLVNSALSEPVQRMKRWSQRRTIVEPAPGLSGADLAEVLATAPDIRYSDEEKKLTAVKNSKYKACFIVDFDPDFYLPESELDKITAERMPEMLNDSPPAYYAFLAKAGFLLTAMCENMDIFWLNEEAPPLPVDTNLPNRFPDLVPGYGNEKPLPVNHDPPTPPPIRQNPPTPPPVDVYRQQQSHITVKIPPPLGQYPQQLVNVPQAERPVMTPPPLSLWKLEHGK